MNDRAPRTDPVAVRIVCDKHGQVAVVHVRGGRFAYIENTARSKGRMTELGRMGVAKSHTMYALDDLTAETHSLYCLGGSHFGEVDVADLRSGVAAFRAGARTVKTFLN